MVMDRTIRMARTRRRPGARPGYPRPDGVRRREMNLAVMKFEPT